MRAVQIQKKIVGANVGVDVGEGVGVGKYRVIKVITVIRNGDSHS